MNLLVPVSWLREYLKTDLAAKTIANYLTASGPSVDYIEKHGTDFIFDIEVTSNRADAFSVFGIAREAHAILSANNQKSSLINPKGLDTKLEPDVVKTVALDAQIADSKLCPRFTAIILEIKLGKSPALIANRLKMCGIRPINNIVDITNYIMLETGQPMHAFDFDKIEDGKMLLRASKEGEKLTTLDGVKRQLPKGTIVIQDAKKLIDLCGIMGGENSQITNRTKRVVFFVQSYNPAQIRKTTQQLAFRTDAAARFEKGVNLENILPTLALAVYLAKKTASAKIISELVDIYPKKQETKTVSLSFKKLNNYLGVEINPNRAIQILLSLGFKTSLEIASLKATTPSWRAQDVESDVDLIEEIARIYGYHNLPSTLPGDPPPNRADSHLANVIELKKALKMLGLTEVITYSIISKKLLSVSQISEKNAVELANPLTDQWQFMRPSLIPSLLEVISNNQNLKSNISLFEIAKTYLPSEASAKGGVKQRRGLPVQDLFLTITLTNSDFSQIKGLTENIFTALKRKASYKKLANQPVLFDQNKSANVSIGEVSVGEIGILSSTTTDQLEIKNTVASVNLNLSKIYNLPSIIQTYHPIPKYPPIIEDISAIFSVHTPLADITSEIKNASALVKKVETIDIFADPKLGELKKSVTLRLTYQHPAKTPTQSEVNTQRSKITKALETNLRAKVRK